MEVISIRLIVPGLKLGPDCSFFVLPFTMIINILPKKIDFHSRLIKAGKCLVINFIKHYKE
jgi:hypothetical protein